jgi:predicted metal-dependent hydrolase
VETRERDLSDHSVRVSHRTKHVHLRFSLRGGLEVIVPPGFDCTEIPELLREKRRWIGRASREIEQQRRLLDPWPHDRIPEKIELRALGETWTVEATEADAAHLRVREEDGLRLHLSGPIGDPEKWRAALRRWLTRRARQHLGRWVEREAENHGLHHGSVSIRWQKSRWGSCSRRSRSQLSHSSTGPTLSLNAGLLFLPPHLMRYVILHELCHTERMDHSPSFWKKLERIEPQARALRDELRSAWRYVPSWLEDAPSRPAREGALGAGCR